VYRKLRAGYTLIELVVVISIILILAAMLLPVFERAVKAAEATSCLANVRDLALANRLYISDYDERLPPALIEIPNSTQKNCWDVLLLPYVGSHRIYLCLADENPTPGPAYTNSLIHSYGINLDLTMVGGYPGASLRSTQIPRPGETILFFDLAQPYSYGWRASWGNMSQYVAARHNQASNFAFCAGNAKRIKPSETLSSSVNFWEP